MGKRESAEERKRGREEKGKRGREEERKRAGEFIEYYVHFILLMD